MNDKRTRLGEAYADYREAQIRLQDCKHTAEAALMDCLDMSLRDAIRSDLVRFNFPVSEGLRRAIKDGDI
jgi:hypothetical protein